uniref:Vacuolar protein sorting-associated protein 52 homolog n=1 Tax=Heterorhabditis bacteriophora TaxID=37862 RepID=A0A1I7X417_HETBA
MSTKDKQMEKLKSLEDCLKDFASADENVVRGALSAGTDLRDFSSESLSIFLITNYFLYIFFQFQFESLFRSIHLAFVDHCSHEFLFVTDFFMVTGQTAVDLHAKIMSRAVAHLIRALDEKISLNFDAISIYLCIMLCDKFRQLLNEREIPSMSGYWETISNQLWIRFDQVMQMHNDSVKTLDVKKMQPPIDTRPHYVGF